MKNIVRYFFIPVFLATFSGCAFMKFSSKKTKIGGTWVPAGVDSLVAVTAGAKADQLFVPKERKRQAEEFMETGRQNMELSESLWSSLQARKTKNVERLEQIKRQQERATLDTIRTREVVVILNNEGKAEEIAAKDTAPTAQIDTSFYTLIDTLILAYMDRAAEDFMAARQANPYDIEAQRVMFDVYDRMILWRYSDTTISAKETEELERIIEIDKSLDDVFWRLGRNYEANDNWPKAYENYKQALEVFLVTPLLADTSDSGTTVIDTLEDRKTLLNYLWDKGRAEAKLAANKNYLQEMNLPHLADSALVSFSRALKIAVASRELWDWVEPVKRQMQWVAWDNLNVMASEKRDAARKLVSLKKFKEAEKEYQELLTLVKTRKARSELLCKLAELE
ncbi:MAG: hypothetical protein ONB05_06695, partial [candidate division KSB1 bacterium]|nr:hypothetical protein [candidate division KSB1 bacterium]